MNTLTYLTRGRRFARHLARGGTALSAAMLVVAVASFSPGGSVAQAATDAGAVQIVVPPGSPTAGEPLAAGASAAAFALAPPAGAACTGDSATGGYRVQSYMVPDTVDPSTLTFGLTGPLPTGSGANFRQPLYTSAGSSWLNKTTAVNTGQLVGLPVLSFAWVADSGGTTFLPAGTYNIGFACTKGGASDTQLDKYWNTRLTVIADANDVPSGLTWAVPDDEVATTTTLAPTTTTVVGSTTTSTTVVGGTTTTSTTLAGATTTTLIGSGTGTNTTVRTGSGGGQLTATGGSPLPIVLWAVLLLVFGRMVILLGRPLRVLPDSR